MLVLDKEKYKIVYGTDEEWIKTFELLWADYSSFLATETRDYWERCEAMRLYALAEVSHLVKKRNAFLEHWKTRPWKE